MGLSVVYFLTKLGYKESKETKFHKLQMEYIERFSIYLSYKDKTEEETIYILKKSLEDNKPYK